ncbi:hypothetical protein ACJIZ3_001111 [Penstemon smallii]|uniref:Plastid lipid-associated protein/fibrillin conserved domain-containing protein n=1 Tax=Penstemon smallii TaxID=265156 RepID=A0ABD3U680_9LAMI
MALSTLSPQPLPPSFTIQSSSAANLLHPTASFPFRNNRLSTTTLEHKWKTRVSFFTDFLSNNKTKNAEAIKEELLEAIAPLDRGAEATPQDQQNIDQLVRKLEAVNPTKEPLKSNLLNGKWELIYTTSQSILQTQVNIVNRDPSF